MAEIKDILPVVRQAPTEAAFVADPYAFYRQIRGFGDFVFWEDYGLPMATTHASVTAIMKHPKMGRAAPSALGKGKAPHLATFEGLEEHSLLEIEPPDHTRLRREAVQAFAGPQIALIAPVISQMADQLIDTFPDEPFDLLEAYAKPLAAQTITAFLGVDTAHAEQLQGWSNDMVAMYQARRDAGIEERAERASRAFRDFILVEIQTRRKNPGHDFISQLVEVERTGGISEGELVSTAILLLNAGHEATAHTLGNVVPPLLNHAGLAEAIAPDSIAGTVEECLRFRPPLHMFKRYVYEDVTIEGVTFSKNSEVGCLLGSACHDDAVWPDGAVFDPFRARRRHVAFGVGIHSCVGAALARLELQIALPVLFGRCPQLSITERPKIADVYHFHGFEQLMVSVR